MKAFISQNFLRNLAFLAESYKLTDKEIKFIDTKMRKQIFPYLKTKYPMSVEKQVNKAFQSSVKSIDNLQIAANDYLYSSQIRFQYRQSGRYDDLIMRFLNQIMTKSDSKIANNETTHSKQFNNLMTELFQKSFDEDWMNPSVKNTHAKNDKDQKKRKQRYEKQVRQYTSYKIGRKISQNTPLYSQDEINNSSLFVKSPAILRILTKRCQELSQKYENPSYFIDRKDGFAFIGSKKIGFLDEGRKEILTTRLSLQNKNFLNFLQQTEKINYKQQVELLYDELESKKNAYIEKYEKVSGKFACKTVNNIQCFIVEYLNKLIDGLTYVSKIIHQTISFGDFQHPAPLNLVSFHVSDLLRCKYSSKQKEVLKIFQEIHKMSDENPNKFKIIRIKNRLKSPTSDILINVKLNNLINCEIQIGVNSSNSDFMNCSNKINYYLIYQMDGVQKLRR